MGGGLRDEEDGLRRLKEVFIGMSIVYFLQPIAGSIEWLRMKSNNMIIAERNN